MADLLPFEAALESDWPAASWQDLPVVLAVSGGADSVALLRAAQRLRGDGTGELIVAHFHHGLRESADLDQQFVTELSRDLQLELAVGRPPQPLESGDEATARSARHEFLSTTARRLGARLVATAHTLDDQAETVLHRILRGSGLAGLTGIPRTREIIPGVALIRPLLKVPRSEVLDYLRQLGQPFRQDPSNTSPRYTRNRLRNELLPKLEREYNPAVREALVRLADFARESCELIEARVSQILERCCRRREDRLEFDCCQLGDEPPLIIREVLIAAWKQQSWPLRDMSHEKWGLLSGMVGDPSVAVRMLPGTVRAERVGSSLQLTLTRPA